MSNPHKKVKSTVCWIKDESKLWMRWAKPCPVAISKHQPKETRILALPRIYLFSPKYVDGRSRRKFIQVKITIETVKGIT